MHAWLTPSLPSVSMKGHPHHDDHHGGYYHYYIYFNCVYPRTRAPVCVQIDAPLQHDTAGSGPVTICNDQTGTSYIYCTYNY